MGQRLRVGILFGGRSFEHEVSLMSAASILAALDRERFEPVPIGIAKDGRWLVLEDAERALQAGLEASRGTLLAVRPDPAAGRPFLPTPARPEPAPSRESRGALAEALAVDVVFPVLHGPYGEDGTVQGLLELAGVAYVGSGVLGSAVGMDKALQKDVLRRHGIPTVDYQLVRAAELERDPEAVLDALEGRFRFPVFVKPANSGSSVGVAKAAGRAELREALARAAAFDRRLLVEEAVAAREIECGVLGNEEPVASLPGEVVTARDFYDYEAKYRDEATRLIVPAELAPEVVAAVQDLAVRSFLALDAAGLARVDFFLLPDGRLLVNELNTMPGFTRMSMYPRLWEASGLRYPELVSRLVELALERRARRDRLRTEP
ncbi:MAG: D-alanine--D-alanine ligase [Clostridia bacterium]|nr:D-alanine--D-alanine ligase [Clostridia bacterium]